MQAQYIEMTQRMYEGIIEDVFKKLNEQSAQGFLQMSESEIIQLKILWRQRLLDLKSSIKKEPSLLKEQSFSFQKPLPRHKQSLEQFDLQSIKKQKIEQPKIEEVEDPSKEIEILFEDDEDIVKHEQTPIELVKEAQKIEVFQKSYQEKQREKTIFDKVRELQRHEDELNEEDSSPTDENDGCSSPRNYHINIYAQKVNKQDFMLHRIKPNKSQRACLELVLFKEGTIDQFIPQANVTFNFKTDNKK